MIEVLSQKIDKKEGTLTIHIQPQNIRLGIVKLIEPQVEAILDEKGIKRGKRIGGSYTVCNKNTFPDDYFMVYELAGTKRKITKKVEESLDKSPEPVKIKKTTTRRKKTGG
mgnify:CR=1 FL=1